MKINYANVYIIFSFINNLFGILDPLEVTNEDIAKAHEIVDFYVGSVDNINEDHLEGMLHMYTDAVMQSKFGSEWVICRTNMSEKTVVRAWSFIVHSRVKLSAGLLLVAFILKVVMGRFYGSFDKGEGML